MTRKDYDKIVRALAVATNDSKGNGGLMGVQDDLSFVAGVEQAVIRIAEVLKADNPSFDHGKFYAAYDRAVAWDRQDREREAQS